MVDVVSRCHDGNVEKRPGRHLKVGHGVSVLKTRHVGPILLRDA